MAQLNFGGVIENVMTREEFPLEKAREVLKNETIAVIGYGVQGPGQSLNLRDNGFNVIVGQRQGKTYDKAVSDGWVPGETLFSIEEACEKGTIIMCLLSDAAVMSVWPTIKPYLTPGKALYFSHGFAITWNDRTGVVPPTDIDVIMVAPKGSGTSLRTMFLEGRGLNSSYAIYQDASGRAMERTIALGIGIGSGYLFETTFIREATSDLTGERGSLMGAIQGLLLAQYETLRENGHEPSEAFNETVEENNKFEPIGGLDYSKAGVADKLDLADVETLTGTFGFPEAEVANVDAIASLMHAMNGNVFTAVAFHVAEGADMAAIAESYKTALTERQWFCGQPDGYAVIKADSEYMIAVYAQQPLEGFKTAALAAIEGAEIVAEGSFAA